MTATKTKRCTRYNMLNSSIHFFNMLHVPLGEHQKRRLYDRSNVSIRHIIIYSKMRIL